MSTPGSNGYTPRDWDSHPPAIAPAKRSRSLRLGPTAARSSMNRSWLPALIALWVVLAPPANAADIAADVLNGRGAQLSTGQIATYLAQNATVETKDAS